MRFLMDTNICSAYMRRAGGITHRMIQYGQENVAASALSLAELYSGAFQRPELRGLLAQIDYLRSEVPILTFDDQCAEMYGNVNGSLLRRGIVIPTIDLLIGSVTLVHDLTLVTHNTADFERIPNLRIEDWLSS